MPLLATTPSPFAPELNGRPVEPEGPGEVPATVGLDVAGLAERIVDLKYELVDGTMVAQPKYAWWFADVGWAVENHGVDPDVEVTIAPHDWAAGRDPQLDTAVRLALQALDQRTPAAPPTV